MNKIIKSISRFIPARILFLISVFLILIFSAYTYFFFKDAQDVERRITSRQKELGRIILLKDEYLKSKREIEKENLREKEIRALSLSSIEELVSKNVKGGKLVSIKFITLKSAKKVEKSGIDLKLSGLTLEEIVSFSYAVEKRGYLIKKFNLAISGSNPNLLDLYLIITEG